VTISKWLEQNDSAGFSRCDLRARGLRNFGKGKSAPGSPPSHGDLNPGVLTVGQSLAIMLR
jgi:hypothetical protein